MSSVLDLEFSWICLIEGLLGFVRGFQFEYMLVLKGMARRGGGDRVGNNGLEAGAKSDGVLMAVMGTLIEIRRWQGCVSFISVGLLWLSYEQERGQ